MKTFIKINFFGVVMCAFLAAPFFFLTHTLRADDEDKAEAPQAMVWGVDYSESQAAYLGLDPQETYSALIHDLGVRHMKIHINWNATEKERGVFSFESLDRQVREAEENDVKLILVIGMKTGRWPECHTPQWLHDVPKEERHAEIIRYVNTLVERYKDSDAVEYWQIENEPFLQFGTCPSWYYKDNTTLLEKEVAAVRALDPTRKIIISDSGELSTWTEAASIGDIVGITMYRSSWNSTTKTFGLNPYSFLSPEFYATKAALIEKYYDKPVISIELQAEPWTARPLAESSLAEQEKSMNPELFDENVAFAKEVGLDAYYFWGAEWWYWMKVKHNKPEIWDKARLLFAE